MHYIYIYKINKKHRAPISCIIIIRSACVAFHYRANIDSRNHRVYALQHTVEYTVCIYVEYAETVRAAANFDPNAVFCGPKHMLSN